MNTLGSLEIINFREGDVYEKVRKVKFFNENILPNSNKLCSEVQNVVNEVGIDQIKLDSYKKEVIGLLESIDPQYLFALSKSGLQNGSPEQSSPQAQLDLAESKKKDPEEIQKLRIANEELKNEVSRLKNKLASAGDLESKYEDLVYKYGKAELLSKDAQDSQIIQLRDVNVIREWFLGPPNSRKGSPTLKLNLLYRANRDGFFSSEFYKKCSKKSPTIIFIKSEYGKVFGGYTAQPWQSESDRYYIRDEKAFLFSLTHKKQYPIKKEEESKERAIYANPNCILAFGFGKDICIQEGCNTQSNKAYTNFPVSYSPPEGCEEEEVKKHLAGSQKFRVEEIEAYEVVCSK